MKLRVYLVCLDSSHSSFSLSSLDIDGHEGVGLRLDGADAGDGLDRGEELLLGGELALLPAAELVRGQRDNHLKVEAAAAHHALHRLDALNALQLAHHRVERLLGGRERGLVAVSRPFHSPK